MDQTGVQKDGDDESEPLVRFRRLARLLDTAEAAELREGACVLVGGRPGAGPRDGSFGFLDGLDVVHAGDEAGAHVDEDVGGGTDHGVELGFYHDWGAGRGA